MAIQEQILRSVNCTEESFNAGEYIFHEGDVPQFYYQIVKGEVRLTRFINGSEYIQDILSEKSSIGESMLLVQKPYLFNAVAVSECIILKVEKEELFRLLKIHPQIFENIYKTLADDTFEKLTLMDAISNKNRG